jgi:hypothetical protein
MMTQVDLSLTRIGRFDSADSVIGVNEVIKNLGRHTFACHIARPPRRRWETSLQASRWILDKGDIGQPRSAEPGP